MINICQMDKCSGCEVCANICPTNCITMARMEGFLYPTIEKNKCVNCNLCSNHCQMEKESLSLSPSASVYAVYSKDLKERNSSSSGGAFIGIAKQFLDKKGFIAAPCFDVAFSLSHCLGNCEKEIISFCGSKYIQSRKNKIYQEVKEHLEKSEYVLFSGTPCEVNGLYLFLGKDYERLYTQDVICHGVASPVFFDKYLEYIKSKTKSPIQGVSFRDKKYGWNDYRFLARLENGKVYAKHHNYDPYMIAFLRNYSIRKSCFTCKFRSLEKRVADITLGDFWRVSDLLPTIEDNAGVTCIIASSKKGKEMVYHLPNSYYVEEIDLTSFLNNENKRIQELHCPKDYEDFVSDLDRKSFYEIHSHYLKGDWIFRLKSIIKSFQFK